MKMNAVVKALGLSAVILLAGVAQAQIQNPGYEDGAVDWNTVFFTGGIENNPANARTGEWDQYFWYGTTAYGNASNQDVDFSIYSPGTYILSVYGIWPDTANLDYVEVTVDGEVVKRIETGAGDSRYRRIAGEIELVTPDVKTVQVYIQGATGALFLFDDWAFTSKADWQDMALDNPGYEANHADPARPIRDGESWDFTGGAGPFFEENPAQVHSGTECLKFWSASAYSATASQSLIGLFEDSYNLSVWVISYPQTTFTLSADNGSTIESTQFTPTEHVWTQMTLPVQVLSAGTLDIAINVSTEATIDAEIDDWELTLASDVEGWKMY